MSNGWTEDPELARLRNSAASKVSNEQEQAARQKRVMDQFVAQHGTMISGGFAQAAEVLRVTGKYGNPKVKGPKDWNLHSWLVEGTRYGEHSILISMNLSGNPATGRINILFGEATALEFFTEQWFREMLRNQVRKLVE